MTNCFNCNAPLPEHAQYCPNCGQRAMGKRISVKSVLGEFIDSIFNIDNRFFRTIRDLFIPGQLSLVFVQGKRRSYMHPVRLLLVSAVVLIAVLNFFVKGKTDVLFADVGNKEKWEKEEKIHQLMLTADGVRVAIQDTTTNSEVIAATNSFYQALHPENDNYTDSLNIDYMMVNVSEANVNTRFARKDVLELDESELIKKYYPEASPLSQLKRQKELRLFLSSENPIDFLLNNITWQALLALPLVALFMRLLYVRRDFYYVEHLVFSIHCTTFFFFMITLIVIADDHVGEWLDVAVITSIGIYLLIAMKRFYRQNWWRTGIKYLLATFGYIVVLTTAGIVVFLLSLPFV